MDCSAKEGEKYSFYENIRKHYPSQKKTLIRLKKKNNINKQLTEIRHNRHKNYLQSKNLKRDKNQSNKEASRCTSMAKSNCSNHW